MWVADISIFLDTCDASGLFRLCEPVMFHLMEPLDFLFLFLRGENTILTGIFNTVIGIPPENNTDIFSNIIHHCSIYLKTTGTGFKGVRHTWWVAEEGTGSRSQFSLHSFKNSFSVNCGLLCKSCHFYEPPSSYLFDDINDQKEQMVRLNSVSRPIVWGSNCHHERVENTMEHLNRSSLNIFNRFQEHSH